MKTGMDELYRQRFEALLNAGNLAFMIFESVREQGVIIDFRWTFVSSVAETIVGRKSQDLLGKYLLQEMPGNRENGLFDTYVQVVETGQPQSRRFHYAHEGLNHYFRNRSAKAGDGFAVAFEDITEQVQTQNRLKESEERYRILITSPKHSVFIASKQQRQSVNSIWTQLTGQSLDDSQGEGWLEVIHAQDRERVETLWRAASATKQDYEFSFKTKAPGNKRRHIHIRGVPRFSNDGDLIEWLGVVTDITEQKQLEENTQFMARVDYILKNAGDPDQLLTDISTEICQYFDLPDCYFSEIDEARNCYHQKAGFSRLKPFEPQTASLNELYPLILNEGKAKRILAVSDTRADERFKDWREPYKSFVSVPLHRGNNLAGSFTVASTDPYDWHSQEQALLEAIAGRTWSTLERLRAEKAVRDQMRLVEDQREILTLTNVPTLIRSLDGVIRFWNKAAEDFYGYSPEEALGQVSHELLQTTFQTSSEDLLRGILEEGYAEEELSRLDKHKNKVVVLSRQAVRFNEGGEPRDIIEVDFDITARKRSEEEKDRLLELTQRSEREALALAEIASSFSLTQTLDQSLTEMAKRVVATLSVVACAIEVYDANVIDLKLEGYAGFPVAYAEILSELRHSGIETLSQRAIKQNEMIISNDFVASKLADNRFDRLHPALREVAWATVVAAPILNLSSNQKGTMTVYYPPEYDPDITDFFQLSTIVSQITLVVQNMQLFAEVQGKAALEERQKLARDLHDSVSQALYGISLGANSAKLALSLDASESKMQEVNRSLDYLIHMAATALAEMKSLIFELRPESLESEGLVAALKKHLRALELRHRFNLNLTFSEEPDTSLKAKEMLYRITQEAMNNVVKHAQATQIDIALVMQENLLSLSIKDNGIGFDTSQDFPGHLGLHSMRDRAATMEATFSVDSHPNQGTTVSVIYKRTQVTQ